MFDMQNISKKIAFYRRAQNLTQMELAEQMDLSFQAVSSWERGATMPDISRLPQLCQILGITIDELMEESPYLQTVHSILNTDAEEQEEISAGQLLELEPVIKPEQMVELSSGKKGRLRFDSYEQIVRIIPFLDEGRINEIVSEHMEMLPDLEQAAEIAPFLEPGLLQSIVEYLPKSASYTAIMMLAPFIEKESAAELVTENISEIDSLESLANLAPFLPTEFCEKLTDSLPRQLDLGTFLQLAPFISREKASALVRANLDEFSDADSIVMIAPFIDRELFNKLIVGE